MLTPLIQVSPEILQATRMTLPEIQLELAITLFQQEKLSFGKARELAGLDFWTFQHILASRHISPHYDEKDLEADMATLARLDKKWSS